jgi:hypothetical protein
MALRGRWLTVTHGHLPSLPYIPLQSAPPHVFHIELFKTVSLTWVNANAKNPCNAIDKMKLTEWK